MQPNRAVQSTHDDMGFVTQFFIRPYKATLVQPPAGSFIIDGNGQVVSSTLPHSFQVEHVKDLGAKVLATFRRAKEAKMPLTEFVVQYSAFKLQAQNLPYGALVYLIPQKPKPDTDFVLPSVANEALAS